MLAAYRPGKSDMHITYVICFYSYAYSYIIYIFIYISKSLDIIYLLSLVLIISVYNYCRRKKMYTIMYIYVQAYNKLLL